MAMLLNLQNNKSINLLAVHVIGRHSASCNTILNNPKASRVHATITWDGSDWLLQDSSTNGTYVNDIRLLVNSNQILKLKDKVYFASVDAGLWEVQDVSEPKSMLVPKTAGTPFMVLDDIVVLPNEESPRIALYSSVEGGWFCESEAGTMALSDGDDVGVDGLIWRFVEATNSAKTELLITNSGSGYLICADFIASQNEEHVALTLSLNEQEFDMGERSHHYLLLLLARRYLKDQEAGFSPLECGWVEKEALVKMLRLDEIHINMQIYRFRKQLVKTLPDFKSLPSLIERRKGELRFVCGGIRIQGGAGG